MHHQGTILDPIARSLSLLHKTAVSNHVHNYYYYYYSLSSLCRVFTYFKKPTVQVYLVFLKYWMLPEDGLSKTETS